MIFALRNEIEARRFVGLAFRSLFYKQLLFAFSSDRFFAAEGLFGGNDKSEKRQDMEKVLRANACRRRKHRVKRCGAMPLCRRHCSTVFEKGNEFRKRG